MGTRETQASEPVRRTLGIKQRGKLDGLTNPSHRVPARSSTYKVSNGKLASDNGLFRLACTLAGVEPTTRQASKWRNRRGRAYAKRHEALTQLHAKGTQPKEIHHAEAR